MNEVTQQAERETSTALAVVNEELEALDGWTIDNPEDQEFAADMLRDVKKRHKALEGKRKTITKPLLEAKRAVDDLFRAPREALEQAERILKGKIAGYLEAVEAANTEAVEAASNAETVDEASEALANVEHVDAPKGVSVRYVWKPRVIAEDLLDRRFLSPDMGKIKAWMKEHTKPDGEPLAIPGVAFDKSPIVSARTGSK